MNSDTESEDDSSVSSDEFSWNSEERSNVGLEEQKNEEPDLENVKEQESTSIIDDHLQQLFTRNYFKKDSEKAEAILSIIKLVPIRKQFTNNLFMRILYKVTCYFRTKFEFAMTILETDYNEAKFYSDEIYK